MRARRCIGLCLGVAIGGLIDCDRSLAADVLAPQVKSALDRQFPGWRFPRLGTQIEGCNPGSRLIVQGDFDGDGKSDYAVEFVYRDELVLFAWLGAGRTQVLARNAYMGGNGRVDQALDVLRKGDRISDGPQYADDAVISLDCSGPATVTYYSLRAGKWHSDLQVTE